MKSKPRWIRALQKLSTGELLLVLGMIATPIAFVVVVAIAIFVWRAL